MRRGRRAVALILLVSLFAFGGSMIASATGSSEEIENEVNEENNNAFPNTSPWLKDTQDNSIYENAVDASEDAQDIKVKKPGRVEKYIAELLRNIGSGVISLLQDNVGISLDGIVYGRVGSGQPNRVNIFAFELRKGNPYGVSGAIGYSLIRGMAFAFLGIQFTAALAKAAWTGQTAKSREEIKSLFPSTALKFAVLMLMPYLLDVALYVRDVVLYGIKEVTGQMITGGATISMSKAFLMNAERSGTFIDALMYLGTVALTIYFMFLYIAVAIDMLICFVGFPVLCMLHSRKRDLINGWIMTVFSNILTPMIDAMLLLIPLLTSLMLSDTISGVSIIQLIMCLLIVPARSRLKGLLGIQSNERNGFLGAMAMMALARAAVGGVKRGIGKAGEMFGDIKKSRTEGELAEIDREEEAYLTGNGGQPERRNRTEDIPGVHTEGENGDVPPRQGGGLEGGPAETVSAAPAEAPYGPELAGTAGDISDSAERPEDGYDMPWNAGVGMEGSRGESGISGDVPLQGGEEGKSRNDMLRNLEAESNQIQGNVDSLRVERAGAMKEDKRLKREMLNHDRNSDEYRALEREKADNEGRVAAIDEQIAGQNRRLNEARRQKEVLNVGGGSKKAPTIFDEQRAGIMAKRADISNFEAPEFKNTLSHAQMQNLYRKRAAVNAGKLVIGTGASVGAAAAMGGASVFMGPSAAALAVAGGMDVGGALGEAAVDGAVSVGRVAGRVYQSGKYVGSQVYTQAAMDYVRPAAASVETSWDNPAPVSMTEEGAGMDILQPPTPPAQAKQQIQTDASMAFSKIIDGDGSMKNSSALRALKEANVTIEKYIVSMREENAQVLTREAELEKRIEAQTEALAGEVMRQMESNQGYQKGTQEYEAAKAFILEKTREIMEKNNRPL